MVSLSATIAVPPRLTYRRFAKRAFDCFAAAAGLIVLLPLLLAVGLLVRWLMGPPVLFRQERPGLHGRPFRIVKFRTMSEPAAGHEAALSDAARLTPFGRLLRATSLDELPELWNVLRGEMSLVGPRPLRMEYLPLYNPEQARRHDVRPGITGWAQINGRNRTSWERRFELDVWYVDNYSALLDLKILVRTVGRVLRRDGISPDGHATMPRFGGLPQGDGAGVHGGRSTSPPGAQRSSLSVPAADR